MHCTHIGWHVGWYANLTCELRTSRCRGADSHPPRCSSDVGDITGHAVYGSGQDATVMGLSGSARSTRLTGPGRKHRGMPRTRSVPPFQRNHVFSCVHIIMCEGVVQGKDQFDSLFPTGVWVQDDKSRRRGATSPGGVISGQLADSRLRRSLAARRLPAPWFLGSAPPAGLVVLRQCTDSRLRRFWAVHRRLAAWFPDTALSPDERPGGRTPLMAKSLENWIGAERRMPHEGTGDRRSRIHREHHLLGS